MGKRARNRIFVLRLNSSESVIKFLSWDLFLEPIYSSSGCRHSILTNLLYGLPDIFLFVFGKIFGILGWRFLHKLSSNSCSDFVIMLISGIHFSQWKNSDILLCWWINITSCKRQREHVCYTLFALHPILSLITGDDTPSFC